MYLRSKQEVTAQAVEQVENKLSNRFNLIDNRIVTNSKGMLKSQYDVDSIGADGNARTGDKDYYKDIVLWD